jgi:hypothetical protein
VDRHPVFPILIKSAPRLYGRTQAEAWADHNVARDCLIRCYKDYGYDYGSKPNYYGPMLPAKHCAAPVRNLIPGKHLGEDDLYQIDERVLFEREDYDKIAALGWNGFWDEHCYVGKRVGINITVYDSFGFDGERILDRYLLACFDGHCSSSLPGWAC